MSPGSGSTRLAAVVGRLEQEGLLRGRPAADVELGGVADDSRRVRAGDLFCAWAGTAVDGHGYLAAAKTAGAAAALVERRVEESELLQVVVSDGRRAAAMAASVVFADPGAKLLLVAVTGTNGKSTTVWLLRHLLASRFEAASLGTLGLVQPNGRPLPGSEALTTPGPVDLMRTLRELADRGVGAVAMEASSHALDQGRMHALRFDAAVFTNLTRDHLDYHGSEEAYRSAKRRLLELLRPDGVAVVNADDPAWAAVAEQVPRSVSFGLASGAADIRATAVTLGAWGARFRLRTPAGDAAVELPLLGAFNVQNALGAAAACMALGFTPEEAAERLRLVPQVPGRLERIADSPCPVLTDYAHTPDALERVLAALRPLTAGRLIVVFGAGGDRDRGKRPLMGAIAERCADLAIVTSDNPRTEPPEAIIDEVVQGMHGANWVRQADRRRAIRQALELARAEDVILLAGKGHETYQVVGREKLPFDERQIVREALAARSGGVTA